MTATWTTPRTWVTGEVVTAAQGNEQWRDNMDWLKANAIEKIDSETVTGSDTSAVTLAITSGYSVLIIYGYARGDVSTDTTATITMTFNSDVSTDYDCVYARMHETDSFTCVEGVGATSINFAAVAGGGAPADAFDSFVVEIPAYANTTGEKICHYRISLKTIESSGNINMYKGIGYWRNTAAISAVTFTIGSGSFVAGSQFVAIGIP